MKENDEKKNDEELSNHAADAPSKVPAEHAGSNAPVATTRSQTGPPKMAFLRMDSSNVTGSCSSSVHAQSGAEPESSSSSLHRRVNSMQTPENDNEDAFEDDLESALLPPSPSRFPNNNNYLRRPLWHPENRTAARQLIRRMGNYLAYATLLTMLVVVPLVLYRALRFRKLDIAAFNSAWVMVCGTVVLSFRLVYLHLTHWYMPDVQKYVVRILWMVPIYAIQSYLSLRFHHARVYWSTIRDFYEAFVIASFVYYLGELLGGQDSLVQILQRKDPALGQHTFPFSLFLKPWELGDEFLLQCRHGVLQYVVFKTTATVLTCVCEFAGIYGEGRFSWLVAYPYLCFFQNISVMYALYCLVVFFHAVNEELRHPVDWRPLGKFLCVKGVVFFTWWQGVIIFYLRDHGIIDRMGAWSSIDVANGLIDYCIVIEMVGFSIAHSYTFTYTEYLPGRLPPPSSAQASAANEEGGGGEEGNGESSSRRQPYRPPATLHQPMKFKDALWSSTVPHETIQDIQRLRNGIDGALNEANRPRSISLQAMSADEFEQSAAAPFVDGLTSAETTDV